MDATEGVVDNSAWVLGAVLGTPDSAGVLESRDAPARAARSPDTRTRRDAPMLMDGNSQAMPTSQEAAPTDAPRDGIARGTEGSPDENRPATVAGSPASALPPAKRARTAATEGVKSFDGAKQFIAQLREAERGPPAEPRAEPRARDPAPDTRFAETAAPRAGTAIDAAAETRVAGVPDDAAAPFSAKATETAPERVERAAGALDAFEEDAVHVLSGLFEEDLSQALSDAGTAAERRARRPKRRSDVGARRASGTSGGSLPSGVASADRRDDRRDADVASFGTEARSGVRAGAARGAHAAGGPSSSRKAADHRRLLKSYMKALFRHLRLPVDIKPADAATYRDRINSALGFWFGETFVPGRTTVECNAPKVVAALLYLATFGRVAAGADDVARVLRKGPRAKNANYAVDEDALAKLGVTTAELRTMFEGPSRLEHGFPRGVPLALPDLDALPAPRADASCAAAAAAAATAAAKPSASDAVDPRPNRALVDGRDDRPVDRPTDRPTDRKDAPEGPPARRDGEDDADANEGAGESGGGAAGVGRPNPKTRARVVPKEDSKGGSPLFSPVGGVTAAFAAAALMPSAGHRGAAVSAFLDAHVAPALAALDAHPVETQLEMLNCAQGAFVKRAASLAKAQHRACRETDERADGGADALPSPADAHVPRGKRGQRKR